MSKRRVLPSSSAPFLSGESRGNECEEGIRITLNRRRLAPPPRVLTTYFPRYNFTTHPNVGTISKKKKQEARQILLSSHITSPLWLCFGLCVTSLLLKSKTCPPPHCDYSLSFHVSPPPPISAKWPFNSNRTAETVTNDSNPNSNLFISFAICPFPLSRQPHLSLSSPWKTGAITLHRTSTLARCCDNWQNANLELGSFLNHVIGGEERKPKKPN